MQPRRSGSALALTALVLLAGAFLARSSTAEPAARASLVIGKSAFGPMLFDGGGHALYAFTRDPHGHATCYDACAKAWPPFVVGARPAARAGARPALIGVTRRRGGTLQVTYSGRPLYYYAGDDARGVVLCQNVEEFGGTWLVVRGSGKLVR